MAPRLDVSRLERGKLSIVLQDVRMGVLTRSVLDEMTVLIDERGHQLSVTGDGDVPPVKADTQLLRQVLLNLVSNAVKYTPPGGTIAIAMERDGALARWSITDSGIGIPKAAQARLFEKFYRADNVTAIETEGTGLGLYLVRLIMEQLGGRVWCASEEGRAPGSWSPCRSRRSGAMQTTTGPIVLVEDDPFIRRACEVALRRRGFAVETAADGEAALDAVRGASPALVLLDLLLPKMTGLEVLRALRTDEATRGVRVLVLSNSSNERDAREITNLGVAGYLVKANLSLQELGDHVARLVEVER